MGYSRRAKNQTAKSRAHSNEDRTMNLGAETPTFLSDGSSVGRAKVRMLVTATRWFLDREPTAGYDYQWEL